MLEQKIEQDLKVALLGHDSLGVTTLRSLKSAILNFKVNNNKRDSGLTDEEVLPLLIKEAKKRQESADLYTQGNDADRAKTELAEKVIIERYLPIQLTEDEVSAIVSQEIQKLGSSDKSVMGQVIQAVKKQTNGSADGSLIARIVKEKLSIS
jgi:uncharacterized protein YqeY